jgi:uncharacterized protein (TIGR02757 family)
MAGSRAKLPARELKDFLDEKANQYNRPSFIGTDPVQVPHEYSGKTDIEIAAFLTATLAWGRKATIISNARRLLAQMEGGPHDFIMLADREDLSRFLPFVHRTFNGRDCIYFLEALQGIYRDHGGLGTVFQDAFIRYGEIPRAMIHFRELFFRHASPGRTAKHVPDIQRNSSGKRLNLFLRWMVRRDARGVDFGLWERIPMAALYVPLDVHTGSVARKLGLLTRRQNDWKAVEELTARLRELDPADPVKYDYALFGLGSFEDF